MRRARHIDRGLQERLLNLGHRAAIAHGRPDMDSELWHAVHGGQDGEVEQATHPPVETRPAPHVAPCEFCHQLMQRSTEIRDPFQGSGDVVIAEYLSTIFRNRVRSVRWSWAQSLACCP